MDQKTRFELATLDQLIQEFEVHNKVDWKSSKTVEKYNFILGMFLRYLQERDRLKAPG